MRPYGVGAQGTADATASTAAIPASIDASPAAMITTTARGEPSASRRMPALFSVQRPSASGAQPCLSATLRPSRVPARAYEPLEGAPAPANPADLAALHIELKR